jgi:hypothetical protein
VIYVVSSEREYNMNANNINKQQKTIAREDKILKRKQNKPVTLLEITRMKIMYAPVSRIFYELLLVVRCGMKLVSNTGCSE